MRKLKFKVGAFNQKKAPVKTDGSFAALVPMHDADLVAGGGADASVGEGGCHDGHALARHLHGAALQVEVQDGVDVAVMARWSKQYSDSKGI